LRKNSATRLSHYERLSKKYRLEMNLDKTVILKLSRNGGKNTVVKINGKEIKEVDEFVNLRSLVEKNGDIQNEINERIQKTTKFYHLAKSLLWNEDI
jgi:hypothetical protein